MTDEESIDAELAFADHPQASTRPSATPSPRPESQRYIFEPMNSDSGFGDILSTLLRRPGRVVHDLFVPGGARRLHLVLALVTLISLIGYGIVVGTFSGGTQLWAAPLKIALGTLLTLLICLPSLYVFLCLGTDGDKLKLGGVVGILLAASAVNALLLVSLAPVAWVFSQSTDSIPFIGMLHLIFWAVGLSFGLALIYSAARFLGASEQGYLICWIAVFILVNLQMMTTLRPLIGTSQELLPKEKKFFVANWIDSIVATQTQNPPPAQHR